MVETLNFELQCKDKHILELLLKKNPNTEMDELVPKVKLITENQIQKLDDAGDEMVRETRERQMYMRGLKDGQNLGGTAYSVMDQFIAVTRIKRCITRYVMARRLFNIK